MTADRMATLRQALAEATCAQDREPVLAALIELAAESGQAGGEDAAAARLGLDEALAYLKAPAGDDDPALWLYLTAAACLARNAGSDLDDAIECLTELQAGLLAGSADSAPDADLTEVLLETEVKLGLARFERASRPDGGAADVDAGAAALGAALDRMAGDDERRPALAAALAMQYATRYVGFGGTEEHRTAALGHAGAGLAWPDAADDTVAVCHLIVAWMVLTRQLTGGQRSAMLARPEIEAARRGGPEAAAMLAALGDMEIAVSDAEAALGHLRQIREAALAGEWRDMIHVLSGMALLAIVRGGGRAEVVDVDRVADGLRQAAGRPEVDGLERGELLAMRAALLAASTTAGDGRPDDLQPTVQELQDAATRLPEGHLIRGPLLDVLRDALGRQVAAAGSAGDLVADVERMVETLEQMPRDAQFARTLALTAMRILMLSLSHRGAVPLGRLGAQLQRAMSRMAPDDPFKPLVESMYWGTVGVQGSTQDRPEILEAAAEGLVRCAGQTPADSVARPYVLLGVSIAFAERYAKTGELRHLDRAETYLNTAVATGAIRGPADPSPGYALVLYLRSFLQLARAQYSDDRRDLSEAAAALEQAVSLMEPEDPLRPRLVADMETTRALREIRIDAPGPPSLGPRERQSFEAILAEARSLGRDHPDFPALAGQAAAGLMLRAIADHDTAAAGQAISLLAEACSVPGLTYRERPRLLDMHGSVLLTRYEWTRDPRDLSHAIDRLEEARRAVEQELGSPSAAQVLQSLAKAYRTRGDAGRGDVSRAVAVGLEALRERAGDVLLQDSDEHALQAARHMTSDAGEMARWFLRRDRPDAAIEALELGRGTVLHAATSGTGLAEALGDAGRPDLAAEWADATTRGTADADAINDLRYRIMLAIEGSPAEVRLLSPPPAGDIAQALRECGADALVYLLPRGDDGQGVAVVVAAGGTVAWLSLPGLHTGPGSPATACLRARRAVEAAGPSPAGDAAKAAWREALGELCDWGWRAAIGPVLGAVPGRRGPRRIVLVPGGELGLVAWHAARRAAGRGYRYAAQEAVLSYASSARQFVEGARRPSRPWAEAPVLISDAAASAYSTELGICHLYAAHYPLASVFGHAHDRLTSERRRTIPGSAAATSADVLAALPHEAVPGASLLHFGCHGQARVPVLRSRLDLGAGNAVDVADILRGARRRAGPVPGGLVVLASCLTDVAEADYDEALTVATAFLSAGASGVVAARWRVPDSDTALFMTAFHRFLNGTDPNPALALRSAQLWMLDPDRTAPGPLPAVLRDEVARADLADPVAWAAFGYQGQLRSGPADNAIGEVT